MQFRNAFVVALIASADASLGAKQKLKLDSNQQVWIENQPILDSTVGDGALNTCRSIASQHVSNPAAPTRFISATVVRRTSIINRRLAHAVTQDARRSPQQICRNLVVTKATKLSNADLFQHTEGMLHSRS